MLRVFRKKNTKEGKIQPFTWRNYYNFYPFFFQIAVIGFYVLFFFFKIILCIWSLYVDLYYKFKKYFFFKEEFKQKLRKKIVIVGGGYAGTFAAKQLQNDFDVTIVDSKDYYEFTPSRLRTLVEPQHCFKVKLSYESILPNTRIITDKVQYITADSVVTEENFYLYDYLVIATGSRYKESSFPPIKSISEPLLDRNNKAKIISARAPNFDNFYDYLIQSQKVLIIGGGTVGVELASEIAEHFVDKEVTLIHSQQKLMNRSPDKATSYTIDSFRRNNINIVLAERIIENTGIYFKTDHGTIFEAELAFVCTGNVPNSELLIPSFNNYINKYGFVKVNENLQIPEYPNIFVAGDITDIPEEEEKLCQTACEEMKVVIANILNLSKGKPLRKYCPSPCPMLVSLGKYDAILTYRGWTFTGFIPALMKEFVEWKEMVWYWNWNHFSLRAEAQYSKNIIERKWRVGVTIV